jgi:hypothetical protein
MQKRSWNVGSGEILDWVKWRLKIFSDQDLARALETSSSTISKIRKKHIPLGSVILLRILLLTGVRLKDLPIAIEFTKVNKD